MQVETRTYLPKYEGFRRKEGETVSNGPEFYVSNVLTKGTVLE